MKRAIFIFLVLFMQTGILAAQQILKFNGIKGEYIVDGNSDINLKAALEKAVNDTKMEAL